MSRIGFPASQERIQPPVVAKQIDPATVHSPESGVANDPHERHQFEKGTNHPTSLTPVQDMAVTYPTAQAPARSVLQTQLALHQDAETNHVASKTQMLDTLGELRSSATLSQSTNVSQTTELSPDLHKEWLNKVSKDGMLLAEAPLEVRSHPEIVRAAVISSSQAFQFASPSLQADQTFILNTLPIAPAILRHGVSRGLLTDQNFLLAAFKTNPLVGYGMQKIAPEQFQDREFVLKLISTNSMAWDVLTLHDPKGFTQDKSFIKEALQKNPSVFGEMSKEWRYEPEYLQVFMEKNDWTWLRNTKEPELTEVLNRPSMQDILKQAIQQDHLSWHDVPATLLKDPSVLVNVVTHNRTAFSDPKMQAIVGGDRELMKACLTADPLLWDMLSRSQQRTLRRQEPALEAAYKQLDNTLKQLNLECLPDRVQKTDTIYEIIRNRTTPDVNDPRPLAVVFYSPKDWNGAFKHNDLDELTKGYRLVYREIETDHQMIRELKESTQNRPTSLLVLGGHGEQTATHWGGWGILERTLLDLSDHKQLKEADFGSCLAPGGHVILQSCSTGEGRENARNIANMMGDVIPHATIYSPTIPTNDHIEFDEHGLFAKVVYDAGEENTYIVQPRV